MHARNSSRTAALVMLPLMWSPSISKLHDLCTELPQLFCQGQGMNRQKPREEEGTSHSPRVVAFVDGLGLATTVAARSSAVLPDLWATKEV